MNNGNPGKPQYPGYAQGDTTQFPPQYPQQNYPPQPYPSAQGGAPQYPQAAYYPQGPQSPQQQQQQSTNVVVVGAGSPIQPTYQTQPYISFTGAILLSCFTIWCCLNVVLGGIAFILALVGQSSAASGDNTGARQMLKASYGLSIAAIVTSIIIIVVCGAVLGSAANTVYHYSSSCQTCTNGYCTYYTC